MSSLFGILQLQVEMCNVNVSCIVEIFDPSMTQFPYSMALFQLSFSRQFVKI